MPFSIAQVPTIDKLCHQIAVVPVEQVYPREIVSDLLTELQAWQQRERNLTHLLVVYVVILLSLLPRHSLQAVYGHLTRATRWLRSHATEELPTEAALCYRRRTLGVGVLRRLAQRVCRPLATPQTPGAFAFGRRLRAIDSTLEDVPDTPANAAFFGRVASGTSASPFPQARCLYLAEAGTHALVNALFAPCRVSEHRLFKGLLRSSSADMLTKPLRVLGRAPVAPGRRPWECCKSCMGCSWPMMPCATGWSPRRRKPTWTPIGSVLRMPSRCCMMPSRSCRWCPLVLQHLLAELRLPSTLLPPRRLRFNPRVLKRSQTKFRRKRSTDQGFHLKHRSFADILLI